MIATEMKIETVLRFAESDQSSFALMVKINPIAGKGAISTNTTALTGVGVRDDVEEMRNGPRERDVAEVEQKREDVGADGTGREEPERHVLEFGLPLAALFAADERVRASGAHDRIPGVEQTEREKAFGRKKPRGEGHREDADVVAGEVQPRELPLLVGVLSGQEPREPDHEPIAAEAQQKDPDVLRPEFGPDQRPQDHRRERHVEQKHRERADRLLRDSPGEAEDEAEEDEGDVAENVEECGHGRSRGLKRSGK